jgi:hypothetical protein
MKYFKSAFVWLAAAYVVFLSCANTDNVQWHIMTIAYIIGFACVYGIFRVWKSATHEEREFMTFAKYIKKYFGWDLFSEE